MTPMVSFLLLFSTLTILSIARAQDRAPHGLANENPMALSPSAVEFFHPKTKKEPDTKNPCATTSNCSPLPRATQVVATQAYESKVSTSQKGKSGIGAGGIAGIVFGLVAFVALVAMGVYYVVITRRENASQANSVQPDA